MTAFLTSKRNGQLAAQMEDARECLADLARRGAQILALEIGGICVPRITLARAPRGIPGGTIRIKGGTGCRIETHAARYMDCQIEWRVEA